MPALKRPAAADPIAERCLSLRGKPVAPLVAKVLYGVLPPTERALCIMHLPTLMPDGRLQIPPLIMETVQMLLYSLPADQGGPDIADPALDQDVLRLMGTAIVQWVASFEVNQAAPTALDSTINEYQESWQIGKLTASLVGHTVMSGTQPGENGGLAKKRHAIIQALPLIQPAVAKYILENRDPPVGESAHCLEFHLACRRMAIETLAAPSLAGRLSEAYKPAFTCKAEDRRISVQHAVEVMRDTALGRKIFAEVQKGGRLPEMK